MFRAGIGIEETNGYRFDPLLLQIFDNLIEFRDIEGHEHLAIGSHPFLDLQSEVSGDKRSRSLVQGVIHLRPIAPTNLQYIPEALSGEQGRLGALALNQGVDYHRCSVNQK